MWLYNHDSREFYEIGLDLKELVIKSTFRVRRMKQELGRSINRCAKEYYEIGTHPKN